jgi:tetratricopeptide (TPR) repeat protein
VYLDIRIDGQSIRPASLPGANASEMRDLTVFADTPVRFDSLYFQVPDYTHQIDIAMIERKSFYQRDPVIGRVSFALDPGKTGLLPPLRGGNMELRLEVMPPVSLKCMMVPGKTTNYVAVFGLEIEKAHLHEVANLQYDLGPGFKEQGRHVRFAELDPFRNYSYAISIFAPQTVTARLDFGSGSTVNLAAFCGSQNQEANSTADRYLLSAAYVAAGNPKAAFQEINAIANPSAAALALKAGILADLGRFSEAETEYKQAIQLAPDASSALNNYAWMIADDMPSPLRGQLLDAKSLAERAIRIAPDVMTYYDTLGWVEFKLGEYDSALQALRLAETLCRGACKSSGYWQEVEYHLGKVYTALRMSDNAKKAFQAALDFQKKSPEISNDKYAEEARAVLGRL